MSDVNRTRIRPRTVHSTVLRLSVCRLCFLSLGDRKLARLDADLPFCDFRIRLSASNIAAREPHGWHTKTSHFSHKGTLAGPSPQIIETDCSPAHATRR